MCCTYIPDDDVITGDGMTGEGVTVGVARGGNRRHSVGVVADDGCASESMLPALRNKGCGVAGWGVALWQVVLTMV